MNWGGSSRLDEPRMTSRFSLDVSVCAARNWKIHITCYSTPDENAHRKCGIFIKLLLQQGTEHTSDRVAPPMTKTNIR
jgi:hypothetical protein